MNWIGVMRGGWKGGGGTYHPSMKEGPPLLCGRCGGGGCAYGGG